MKHVLFWLKHVLLALICVPFPARAQVVESRTPEGLTVWVAPRPGLPKVTALLVVRGGAAADPRGLEGMTELLAYTVAEGTRSRSAQQIAEDLQEVGGELRADWTPDDISLEVTGLSDGLGRMLQVLADVAMKPSFPAAEVSLVNRNLVTQLAERESTPEFVGEKVFARALFGEHPYSITHAARSVLQALGPDILKREHARRFRPDRALLVIVGDVAAAAAARTASAAFAGWRGVSDAAPPVPSPAPRGGRRILLVDRPDSTQSHIVMGRLAPLETDPRYFATLVGSLILGGMGSGRIMENLRENKGWSYTPSSRITSLERAGVLQLIADVRTEVTAPTLVEAFYELDRMWSAPPVEEELQRAKRYAAGSFLVRTQVHEGLAGALAKYWLLGEPPGALSQYVPRLNAVTLDDLRRVCEALFPALQQTVVVIVGDAARLQPVLSRFGAVEMVTP
jgi:predicted Zn-dependent peptidase